MRLLIRIVAVLVVAVVYSIVFWFIALASFALTTDPPDAPDYFLSAVDDAKERGDALPCGLRPSRGNEQIHLSHRETVQVARCLHRRGELTASQVAAIRAFPFEYTYGRSLGQEFENTNWTMSAVGAKLATALRLVGLGLIGWFVGFRIRWWRKQGPAVA